MARKRRAKVYDFDFSPTCDRCHGPVIGEGFRDVTVRVGPTYHDRRHFGRVCDPCLHDMLRHSQMAG